MAAKFLEGVVPWFSLSMGPALMLSMGYIDLGKWVASVDSGAQFGFDLVLPLLFFNCMAILWQYLATRVALVSDKNLAELCSEEYSRKACIFLGVQAEISLIASDLTMILGITYGLSILLGVELFPCVFLSEICGILLPFFVMIWNNLNTEALYTGIAGVSLVFYVLGVLISQPEFPIVMSGIFPKLGGENAYSLMALLGSNIMAHNFYIHSTIVQRQRRSPNISMGALFHDHFFSILFIFIGIFLANHVSMNSAATAFGNTDAKFHFHDVHFLMEQIFRSPVTPIAFLLVLIFSSQITALTRNIGSQVILRYFFGIDLPLWTHHVVIKSLSVIPALHCTRNGGAEGTYQLLIFCQTIQAMLLISSAVPLFRVSSSEFLMGALRIPFYLEVLAQIALFTMLSCNVIFLIELLFGNSRWVIGLTMNCFMWVPHAVLFTVACSSLFLALYLAITPLNSGRNRLEAPIYDPHIVKFDDNQEFELPYEPELRSSEMSLEGQLDPSTLDFDVDIFGSSGLEQDSRQSVVSCSFSSPSDVEKPVFVAESRETENTALVLPVSCEIPPVVNTNDTVEKHLEPPQKNDREGKILPPEHLSRGILPTPVYESSIFPITSKVKVSDGVSVSKSLPKLTGLGRAARKEFGAILDEFWGHLFDFHGKLTQDASSERLGILLGLDEKTFCSSVKSDDMGGESANVHFVESDRGSVISTSFRDHIDSPRRNHSPNFGMQSWACNTRGSDGFVQSGSGGDNFFNLVSERNQLLHQSRYSSIGDYQPATIHGYQVASYLRKFAACRNQISPSLSIDQRDLRDQAFFNTGQDDSNSWGTQPNYQLLSRSRLGGLQHFDQSSYEASPIEAARQNSSSSYMKKYHTSPDISALISSVRNSSFLDENSQWGDQSGALSPLGRMGHEQPSSFNSVSSPTEPRGETFSRTNYNANTGSLWSQPLEQLFGMASSNQGGERDSNYNGPNVVRKEIGPFRDSITTLLHHLRFCLIKLLKLHGSDWLFKQNGGVDEELIDWLAATIQCQEDEKEINQKDSSNPDDLMYHLSSSSSSSSRMNCGVSCVWSGALVVSFGVWCIRRLLEFSIVESRPELWGKYTYVLNRLQGVLEPAFCKPRPPLSPHCSCLETHAAAFYSYSSQAVKATTASMVLDMIKEVETALSGRKGRAGTAAGDVAFPKGKENLVSVLKRYRRRLSNKSASAAGDEARLSAQRGSSSTSYA